MSSEQLFYDVWIEEALRTVIERALTFAKKNGLPGDHHFYITFKTGGIGVEVPAYIRTEHPDEMTIVIQHQFDNLTVTNKSFSVTLRFKGKPEQLVIPFSAITSFADPSVNFGLQLKTMALDEDEVFSTHDPENQDLERSLAQYVPTASSEEAENEAPPKSGEVITLDAFRNKRP